MADLERINLREAPPDYRLAGATVGDGVAVVAGVDRAVVTVVSVGFSAGATGLTGGRVAAATVSVGEATVVVVVGGGAGASCPQAAHRARAMVAARTAGIARSRPFIALSSSGKSFRILRFGLPGGHPAS